MHSIKNGFLTFRQQRRYNNLEIHAILHFMSTSRKYLPYLDALRGIAALVVMTSHFINWKYGDQMTVKILTLFISGGDAVSLFFVLSGFVLSYPVIVLDNRMDVGKFYINRFFRLWPAFFITILLNSFYWERGGLFSHISDIYLTNETHFWDEALLLRGHPHYYFPSWTLTLELTISLLMPFLIFIAANNKRLIKWMVPMVLVMGGQTISGYVFHFCLGISISCIFHYLNSEAYRSSRWYRYRYFIIIAAIPLYMLDPIDKISPFGPSLKTLLAYLNIGFHHFTAFSAFIFIAAIIQSKKAKAILSHSSLRFFGKISYGIYLMHWLIVMAIFDNWDFILSKMPNVITSLIIMFIACFLITTLLATLTHYLIELPFIRWSKRLTGKMKPTVEVRYQY